MAGSAILGGGVIDGCPAYSLCGMQYFAMAGFIVVFLIGYKLAKDEFDQWRSRLLCERPNVPDATHNERDSSQVEATPLVDHQEPSSARCKLLDISDFDEDVKRVCDHVTAEDWRSVHEALRGADTSARRRYVNAVCATTSKSWPQEDLSKDEELDYSPMLTAWFMDTSEDDIELRVLRAEMLIAYAWHARSSATADRVHPQAWPRFSRRIELAKLEVEAAVALDSSEPLIYSSYVTVLRGSRHRDESKFREVLRWLEKSKEPFEAKAHCGALQFCCTKWGGSRGSMFAYDR